MGGYAYAKLSSSAVAKALFLIKLSTMMIPSQITNAALRT
jgi:ABC-type glycerol-3-phosphate transport system permease component